MIVVLTGENIFALRQTLQKLIDESGLTLESYEASSLEQSQLIDILQGQSLFSEQRLVVIDEADREKSLWASLKDILPAANPDTTVVLVSTAPDRRTATYKWLQKNARVVDHPQWRGGDTGQAERWLKEYADQQGVKLPADIIREMVSRATRSADDGKPVIDQQQLANATLQLSYSQGGITTEGLDAVLASSVHENIFELLTAALDGESGVVQVMVDHLSLSEDGHRAMGLLASQVTNLAAVALADKSTSIDQIAQEVGAHPFALRQMTSRARRLSRARLASIVEAIAGADLRLKRSEAEPWVLIRTALLAISQNK